MIPTKTQQIRHKLWNRTKQKLQASITMAHSDPVGDFYVHLLQGSNVATELTSSTKLLNGQPSVIHFYDGGWGGCRPCAAKMEEWAGLYENVRFLTVCVDAIGVAKQFGMMFGLSKAINCHIPSREYFPVGYGQLGCAGFIVSDEYGFFVSRKTKAFTQYGNEAFTFVEDLLFKRFEQRPSLPEHQNSRNCLDIPNDALNKRVPSVGVKSIDFEHEQCENALSMLQSALNTKALEHLLGILKEHFAHEEELMKSHEVGTSDDRSFSPLTSHARDHTRILELGYGALATSRNCSSASAWHTANVDPSVAKEILHAFRLHAVRFDKLLEDYIPVNAE